MGSWKKQYAGSRSRREQRRENLKEKFKFKFAEENREEKVQYDWNEVIHRIYRTRRSDGDQRLKRDSKPRPVIVNECLF